MRVSRHAVVTSTSPRIVDNDGTCTTVMTSYLSTLLWGTSQLDDAVGMLASLLLNMADSVRRQGDLRVIALGLGGHRSQPRNL